VNKVKKEYRVKKDKEFQAVFTKGASVANRQFVVYALKKEQQTHFRVGLPPSVSKKIGNAVVRNQVKRYLREACQQHEASIAPNHDLVIIPRNPAAKMTAQEVADSLRHVLKRSGVWMRSKK
jgi:ribonuclease P protein component